MTTRLTELELRLKAIQDAKLPRRVRALGNIYYVTGGTLEVNTGAIGVVEDVTCGGSLLLIRWPGQKVLRQTSFDSVELLPEARP